MYMRLAHVCGDTKASIARVIAKKHCLNGFCGTSDDPVQELVRDDQTICIEPRAIPVESSQHPHKISTARKQAGAFATEPRYKIARAVLISRQG